MSDRRVMRSKTRGSRRPVVCHSCEEDETDTSTSDQNNGSPVTVRHGGGRCRGGGYCSDSAAYSHTAPRLPPIGVYWDIENCQIPRGKSAVAVAQAIRDQFFSGYRETEFVVVCDVKRESPQVIQDLENAQVNVIHVGSQSKNAADEKLRQSIRRFADTHGAFGSFAAIVLISGDINFAPDLCDLRHRQKIHVILVHNDYCSESLRMCASETYSYSALVAGLPLRGAVKAVQQAEVTVSGLPSHHDPGRVRARLKRLAENCGGRVGLVAGTQATVRFPSLEFGIRAQKRMNGEDVFGNQINVTYPVEVDGRKPMIDQSPTKNSRKPFTIGNRYEDRKMPMMEGPRSLLKAIPPFNNGTNGVSDGKFKQPYPVVSLFNQENVPNPQNSKFNESSWENIQNKQLSRRYNGGRPILGRQHGKSFSYESKTNEGYSNGRHSLDSMLDFEVERDEHEREKNATFENWLRNSISNLESRKSHTPSPSAVLGINTSIPPPPIVNLPRRNDKYFFHPIDNQANGHSQSSPSPASSNDASESVAVRCPQHSRVQSVNSALTSVTVRLSDFSAKVMALVTSHNNRLPLASLRDCYEAQFEPMVSDGRSVTLEHLVTCVRSVELVTSGGKHLRLTTNISPTFNNPETLEGRLVQLSKDIENLLKNQPKCQLVFDQVIPMYNRVYGRHCRLSDYGCSKLIQLLEKLSTVVQVMGEGLDRVVTLTHRVQMQRFTADLMQVLQSVPTKQLTIKELPQTWFTTMGHALQPTDYGLCFLEDLLDLVPTSSAVVNGETISLTHSPRQPVQIQRTDKIIAQVVELLSTVANFTMEFSKFCPAYYHHFGVQCKLADYGFTKLVDLFEAIPHIVMVEGEMETGRRVALTHAERLKVLSARVLSLVEPRSPPGLYVDALLCAYLWQYGHALRPDNYGCATAVEAINKLTTVKIINTKEGQPIIIPTGKGQSETKIEEQNYYSQPKANEKEETVNPDKIKPMGTVSVSSTALLNLLKKAKDCSAIENGTNGTDLMNQFKPLVAPEPVITLLSPAEFLKPLAKSPVNGSIFPSSPDPSVLPKPVGLTLSKVNNGFDFGSKLLEDLTSNEQSRCKQRVKLAPQFCSPLQHK